MKTFNSLMLQVEARLWLVARVLLAFCAVVILLMSLGIIIRGGFEGILGWMAATGIIRIVDRRSSNAQSSQV